MGAFLTLSTYLPLTLPVIVYRGGELATTYRDCLCYVGRGVLGKTGNNTGVIHWANWVVDAVDCRTKMEIRLKVSAPHRPQVHSQPRGEERGSQLSFGTELHKTIIGRLTALV